MQISSRNFKKNIEKNNIPKIKEEEGMFKQRKWVMMGILVIMLMTLTSVAFAAAQDFTLVNSSGYNVTEFYVAPADGDSWEDNLLKGDVLRDGEQIDIVFDNADRTQYWNFYIIDSSGKEWKWENKKYDLTAISTITYSYKNGKGWITWE